MSHKITVLPSEVTFEVTEGETILQAAQRQHIDFPFRCQNGVCTSCVCKHRAGEVSYGDRDESSLMLKSADGEQFVYGCIGYPQSDMVLHHPFIK